MTSIARGWIPALLAITLPVLGGAAGASAQTLRMGVGAQVTSLDPHFHNISPNNAFASMVFDNLLEMDPNSRPIAATWRCAASNNSLP